MIEFESIGYVDVQYNLLTERFAVIIDGRPECIKDISCGGRLYVVPFASYYFDFNPKVRDKVFAKFPNLREGEYDDYAMGYESDGFNDGNIEDVVRYIRLLEKRVA